MTPAGCEFGFTLNGDPVRVSGTAPQVTLLDFIRSRGLTGAKEGCAEGECGACAVLFLRNSLPGTVWSPVNSCLVPLPAVAGQEVFTVEALAESGELAEVQSAMASFGGSQCGYCTPGFIVSMFAEHHRRSDRAADPHALGGNLCRCTGYRPIRDALLSLGPPRDSQLRRRLDRPAPALAASSYETSDGRFSRPCDLAACFALLDADPDAQLVAGNTDLGVVTNLRDRRFRHLISLEGIAELQVLERDTPDRVVIGAGLTLSEIADRWHDAPPVIREWLPLFASPLLRNRATLGGSLATASPIGDSAPLLLAMDAELLLSSSQGDRLIPLHEFFRGYRQTVLRRNEIIRAIQIPLPASATTRFYKVAKRSVDDISTAAAAIAIDRDDNGVIRKARLAFGGVAAIPLRVQAAEQALEGTHGEETARDAAKEALRHHLKPLSDHRGSAEYRLAMAQSLIDKFFYEWHNARLAA